MSSHAVWRRRLVHGLRGRVVEIGAGSGGTFAHYPRGVTEVLAIEPDPRRRALAAGAARGLAVEIRVLDGVAERLPVAGGALDGAVTSLALCSVADATAALGELRRVLRPDGELRFLEHVVGPRGPRRALLRAAAPIYSRLPDGCRIDRDTEAAIAEAGFAIERCEHFLHADGPLEPAIPHILGVARPSAGAAGAVAREPRQSPALQWRDELTYVRHVLPRRR